MVARSSWSLVAVLLLAGCAQEPAPTVMEEAPPFTADFTTSVDARDGTGTLTGRVVDEEVRPVPGAHVTLVGFDLAAVSSQEGSFNMQDVPVGTWTMVVQSTLHFPARQNVTVERDETSTVEVTVATRPTDGPYFETVQFEGHFTCAHEIPIWTGDCMLLYESQTGENDAITTESNTFRTLVGPGWESVVLELVWTYAANNQLDGMRLYLENGNGTETGHSYKVARTDGKENPLRVRLDRGEPHPRADYYVGTGVQAYIADQGEESQIRVFPRGLAYDQTSQVCSNQSQQQGCFLGVGVGIDIRFTVYATVFYGERAPETFTATPPV